MDEQTPQSSIPHKRLWTWAIIPFYTAAILLPFMVEAAVQATDPRYSVFVYPESFRGVPMEERIPLGQFWALIGLVVMLLWPAIVLIEFLLLLQVFKSRGRTRLCMLGGLVLNLAAIVSLTFAFGQLAIHTD